VYSIVFWIAAALDRRACTELELTGEPKISTLAVLDD
jgi:hypothetical protein